MVMIKIICIYFGSLVAALGNARTAQGGLAGVLDSFNQAGASTLETAFGLHQEEQQF